MRTMIGLMLLVVTGCREYDMQAVRDEAKRWSSEMGYRVDGMSCSNIDSDGDGYVSCSVKLVDVQEPLSVECRASRGAGCKLRQPKVYVQQ